MNFDIDAMKLPGFGECKRPVLLFSNEDDCILAERTIWDHVNRPPWLMRPYMTRLHRRYAVVLLLRRHTDLDTIDRDVKRILG